MVLLRKYGHRWLIPSRHYRTVNPLSIALFSGEELFSYPGLKEGKKCPIRLVGGGQCQFFLFISSQAPYPYLFLGWHNKERWCQERTHTHHFLKVRDRQGAPIDVKTWLHWTGTTICRLLPLVPRLLVECVPCPCSSLVVFSLVADRLSSPLSRLLIRASHSSPLSFVPLLRKSRGLCVFRKLKSLVKLKTEEFPHYERCPVDGRVPKLRKIWSGWRTDRSPIRSGSSWKSPFFFFLVKLLETGEFKYNLEDLVEW